jgi:hypothetical protein
MHSTYLFFPHFGFGLITFLLFGGAFVYFLPTIIAIGRRNSNTASVFVLNLLLGWSLIGWIVALVWALAANSPAPIIVNNTTQAYKPEPEKRIPTQQEKIDQLRQLKQLLDEGALTQAEFEKQKAAILS